MDVNAFVQKGWADHGDAAAQVMAGFPEGIALVRGPSDAPPLAALIVHVAGEHLGRWEDGLELLDTLAAASRVAEDAEAVEKLERSRAVLHLCAGDREGYENDLRAGATGGDVPSATDRIRVLAIAASALAGQARIGEAGSWFREALALASYGPGEDDPAARALAITGNNLACSLEELPERGAEVVDLMKLAARTARKYWEIAGGWTEVERAEYRLAMTLIAAGEPEAALRHAELCKDVCLENDAAAAERFFAHEVLARARHATGDPAGARRERDAAADLVPDTGEGMREYCEGELAKLDAVLTG